MKITYVGHASILVEANGLRILSDPWWSGACFGAQWWLHPDAELDAVRQAPLDYIYISHGHHDHLHPGTLRTLPRTAKVLVSRDVDIAPSIRELGFEVQELEDGREYDLGRGVRCRILPTWSDDTLMTVTDGRETCVNLNDALHSAPEVIQNRFVERLRSDGGRIDYVFCGYGMASHFPNCYRIPGKDDERTAARRQHHFNQAWARIVHGLRPGFAFPFAADVVLLEDELFPLNEAVHNTERPTDLYTTLYGGTETRVLDVAPGFTIEKGAVVAGRVREPVSHERLRMEFREKIERANRCNPVEPQAVREMTELVRGNLQLCMPYLESFPGAYRCLIELRNSEEAVEVAKRNGKVTADVVRADSAPREEYDLVYTTRAPYLRKSLTSRYGREVLFVGSGGIFRYRDREAASRQVHAELQHVVRWHEACPKPRPAGLDRLTVQAKQVVKGWLGIEDEDLYDLDAWTVYADSPRAALRTACR